MRRILLIAALSLPWLTPIAPGPSTWFVPWLATVACGGVAWASWQLGAKEAANGDWARYCATSWLLAALVSSAIGLCQYFGVASHFDPLMHLAMPGEAVANLRQRNQFASLTSIGAAAVLWWAGRFRFGGAAATMVLLAVANAATVSRTGLLQLILLLLLTAAWRNPDRSRRLGLCLIAIVAYLLAALLLPFLLELIVGVEAESLWERIARDEQCSSRLVLWSNVLQLIFAKPWAGWGLGELDYAHYVTLYPGMRFCGILDNAHNLPLHVAVEAGIPAAVALCSALAAGVWAAKPWRELHPDRQLGWTVLAVLMLHSMLEYPLWYGPFQLAFLCSLGLLVRRAVPRPVALTLAPIILAGCAFAADQYRQMSQVYLPPEARSRAFRQDPLALARKSLLFRQHVTFAELTTTPLGPGNAKWTFEAAQDMLHFSPEPRVVQKLIESARLLDRHEEAQFHADRFRAAFPQEHEVWSGQMSGGR